MKIAELVQSEDLLSFSRGSSIMKKASEKEIAKRKENGHCFLCNGYGGGDYGSNDPCRSCGEPPECNWY